MSVGGMFMLSMSEHRVIIGMDADQIELGEADAAFGFDGVSEDANRLNRAF